MLSPNVCEIGDAAFRDAKFRKMLLPSSITIVGRHLFWDCERMFSLELSTSVTRTKNYACMDCASLRNVALPPRAGRGGLKCFHGCLDLLDLFGTEGGIKDALRYRFRNRPVHSACYYHAHVDIATTMSHLDGLLGNADGTSADASPSMRARGGGDADCLGMTPLHILACSKRMSIELYAYMRRNLASDMSRYDVVEDRWGCLPFFYALLGSPDDDDDDDDASSYDASDLFLDDLRRTNPAYVFDVRRLIEGLCRCSASLRAVRYVFDMDRDPMFPHEFVDWDQCVSDLSSSIHAVRVPVEVFRYLIRRAMSDRIRCLGIKRYRIAIMDEIDGLPTRGNMRHTELRGIKLKLAFAEFQYGNLREATFVLELALWKARMNECNVVGRGMKTSTDKMPTNKRAKMDKDFVCQCRIHCGAEIVIRNILPYLIENMI